MARTGSRNVAANPEPSLAFVPRMSTLAERFPLLARLWSFLVWLRATLGTIPLLGLAVVAAYALYVAKAHLGIDIFPDWGLHLPGPRTLVRIIARKFES